jgi:lipopolysaccharide/colanic/teichoic acid biosynthesis glycosyltransferase
LDKSSIDSIHELESTMETYAIKYELEAKREYLLKRPFDILLSFLGIVFSFPLWIIIAFAIWIEDGRPVLFCSERVGWQGVIFKHIKFRTMIKNADKIFGPVQAMENDHRITRVGRFLRVTAMDELPQLWNIIKGDMSFVGPRPLLPAEIEIAHSSSGSVLIHEIPGYWKRHSVRPGLTGIAQIFAPRDIIRRRKFYYDLIYVRRQSLWLDIKLILLSFWITFRGKWESRGSKF